MRKVNTNDIEELAWTSPKGTFEGFGKQVSEGLGREPASMDLTKRHPFDIEIARIPAGKKPYPFHSHGNQWEFYHVISGNGIVRHDEGETQIVAGDAFLFQPGQAHQIIAGTEELVLYVVADNPVNESCHYPDSNKWVVKSPHRHMMRGEHLDYFDGEE